MTRSGSAKAQPNSKGGQEGQPWTALTSLSAALQIGAIWALSVAQPIFDMLGRYPDFLVAHDIEATELVALSLGICGLAPLVFYLPLRFLKPRNKTLFLIVYTTGLVAVTIPLLLLILLRIFATPGLIVGTSIVLAMVFGWFAVRSKALSSFLTLLSPAILLVPAMLLFWSPASEILSSGGVSDDKDYGIRSDKTIVFVVFDELPLISLLDSDLAIDSQRFPNFAALSREANWYPRTTAVSVSTTLSVPSMLDGLYPRAGSARLPNLAGHPDNLFTLFAPTHDLFIFENLTRLAPESARGYAKRGGLWSALSDIGVLYLHLVLPLEYARTLPVVTESWGDFGRAGIGLGKPVATEETWASFRDVDWSEPIRKFHRFLATIQRRARPGFHFFHSVLPHSAWKLLPDGRAYTLPESRSVPGAIGANRQGVDSSLWGDDEAQVARGYQCHLLQVGLVDWLLGELVDRLKQTGLWEDSLLIVGSDHGCAFRAGEPRRALTESNFPATIGVPLFIRLPGQQRSLTSERLVEISDIPATVADALGFKLPWANDGISTLVDNSPRDLRFAHSGGDDFQLPGDISAPLAAMVREKVGLLGSGDWESLFRLGPAPELVGSDPETLFLEPQTEGQVELEGWFLFSQVDLNATFLPLHIRGQATGEGWQQVESFAIAVNGLIRATTKSTFKDGSWPLEAIISQGSLRQGPNEVAVFRILRDGHGRRLQRVQLDQNSYQLVLERGRQFLILNERQRIPTLDSQVVGWVVGQEEPARGQLVVAGWAIDEKQSARLKEVVVFVDGQFAASCPSGIRAGGGGGQNRKPGSIEVGLSLSLQWQSEDLARLKVQVFGVTRNGVAGELNYPSSANSWPFKLR